MAVQPIITPRFRAFDANGDPLSGGLLYSYEAGTTTPLATYTTRAGSVANANPVVLNANGEADIWLTAGVEYKFVLKDSAGVTQWTVDNVPSTQDYSLLEDGSVSAPALSFEADTNTGIYRPAADQLAVAGGGVLVALFAAAGAQFRDGTVGAPGLAFLADTNTGFYRTGNDAVALALAGAQSQSWTTAGTTIPGVVSLSGSVGSNIPLSGTDPASTTGFANTLTPKNTPKAWARVQTNGAGGVSVLDGFNIGSSAVDAGKVTLTLATALANANGAILVTPVYTSGTTGIELLGARFISASALEVSGLVSTTAPAVSAIDFAASIRNFMVLVFGEQ